MESGLTHKKQPPHRWKVLAVWLVGLLLAGAFLLAIYYYQRLLWLEELKANARTAVRSQVQQINSSLRDALIDCQVQADIIERLMVSHGDDWQAHLPQILLAEVDNRPVIQQLRILDRAGMELLRIQRNEQGSQILAEAEPQDNSTRYYFQQARSLEPGQFYLSPVDLNVEHGEIEVPHRPILRIVRPLFFQGQRAYLVTNLDARSLLAAEPDSGLEILNTEGYWLGGRPAEQLFGHILPHGLSFAVEHPDVWAQLTEVRAGQFFADCCLYTFETANHWPQAADHGLSVVGAEPLNILRRYENFQYAYNSTLSHWLWGSFGAFALLTGLVAWRYHLGKLAQWRARQAVEQGRDLREAVFRTASVGLAIVDVDGRWQEVNEALGKLLGREVEALLGTPMAEVLPRLWIAAMTASPTDDDLGKWTLERPDGSQCKATVSLVRSSMVGQIRYIFSFTDVTGQHRMLKALEDAEAIAHLGHWVYDVATGQSQWSAQLFRIFELDPCEGALGMDNAEAYFTPHDHQLLRDAFRNAIDKGEDIQLLLPMVTATGHHRMLHLKGQAVRSESGHIVQVVGTAQDITHQQELELALQENEQRLRTLVDNMPAVVFRCRDEADWPMLFLNDQVKELTGYSPTELMGSKLTFSSLIVAEDRGRTENEIAAQLQHRGRYRVQYRLRRRDGSIRQVVEQGGRSTIKGAGEVQVLDGVILDVTEQHEAEAARRLLGERLRLATEAAEVGIWELDLKTQTLKWDDTMFAIYNVPKERFAGGMSEWRDCVHPEDLASVEAKLSHAIKRKGQLDAAFRIFWPDNSERHIHAKARIICDEHGVASSMIGVNWDITDEVERQEQINQLLRRLRLATASAGLGIWEWRPSEDDLSWDGRMRQIFGCSQVELTRSLKDFRDRILPADIRTFDDAIRHSVDNFRSLDTAFRIRWEDGSVHHIKASAVIVRDSRTKLARLMGTCADVTTEQEAAKAMREAKEAAEAAARTKSSFLAAMSHEIRTPMNGVIGMTNILADTPLNEEQREYLGIIKTSGETLLALINDILDFSKIEADRLTLEQIPFDLSLTVSETLEMLAPQAQSKGLELVSRIKDEVPQSVIGDVTRLRQILINLVGNAVKFTRTGEVYVEVSCPARKGAFAELQFMVRDTGIGISPDKQHLLFQSFTQVDASNTREYGGTGLGLAICKRLVSLMNGDIWVESELGQGAAFYFSIRLPVASEQTSIRPPAEGTSNLPGRRLLIVDDVETNCRLLSLQAKAWGMEPTCFVDAQEALRAIKEGATFDVAIIDGQMPQMSGEGLAKNLGLAPETRDLPLILLSSTGETPAAGNFSAVLTKPARLESIEFALNTALEHCPRPVPDLPLATLPAAPLRIMLAEDNRVNQRVTCLMLQKIGYSAEVVENGEEVLKRLEQDSFDVILMDVQMPIMDGCEAARRLCQKMPKSERPFIIALTAGAMEGDRERALEAGMDDYITKPVAISKLEEALQIAASHLRHATA